MFNLTSIYKPLTANGRDPIKHLPCAALRPFIADYWGTEDVLDAAEQTPGLVIPDTCRDVIFEVNHATDAGHCWHCGMDEAAYFSSLTPQTNSCFAIRFYCWSTHFFDDCHNWLPFFTNMLLSTHTIHERIAKTEQFLLKKLDASRSNDNVMNALYHILKHHGNAKVPDICGYASVSQRQLERLFSTHIGTTMKKTANLVRYQNLWRDVANLQRFDVLDAVDKYGYTDQSHLLRSFAKYHYGMTPAQARRDVVFLQDKTESL